MPRSRRRHHSRSRSRSRSHSHDRDREPKRRRVESPDSSHHRRSVSVDSEPSPQKIVKPVADSEEISNEDLNSTVDSTKDLNTSVDSTKDLNLTAESTNDLNSTIDSIDLTTDTANKLLNTTLELDSNSKKLLSPAQKKKNEERIKLRQEREEQRIKERKEREDQKRKEKEDRELQRRKEREEKEVQKRKEREEKEEQKRKEREEKEEQKRKEREEKEEQKRKEREEKEEQKRKEREEKELKKQQEIDEKNRDKKKKEELMLKEKTAFVNFFVPRKSSGPVELKKPEEEKKNAFMPFEVKSDMRVAPIIRISISTTQKDVLTGKINEQNSLSVLYLDEIKNGKKLGRCSRTWPVEDENDSDSVILLEETEIGERLDEEKPKVEKMRAKLLKFHENRRPAYFGTWRKKSKAIKSRKPLVKDTAFFDYDVDSDDDWEEEEPGEDIAGSDDEEKETEADDYEVDNEFFVPHGYLSDEEGQDETGEGGGEEPQGEMETKLKLLQEEFEKEMSCKTERIKPRLIGCIWENKLVPKIQDAIHQFLEDRMMIVCGPIRIEKRDLMNSNVKLSSLKNSTPSRKQLGKEYIPDYLTLIHGNTNNQNLIVNEFMSYLATKELDKPVSKASLFANLKNNAKWKKCPDEGKMHKKYCWYVEENVRKQFNLKLELPNKWTYIGVTPDEFNTSKKKLIV